VNYSFYVTDLSNNRRCYAAVCGNFLNKISLR